MLLDQATTRSVSRAIREIDGFQWEGDFKPMAAIYYHEGFAAAGGLLAYGPKLSEFNWRRAAVFVDKLLKGAKAADLPVEQPLVLIW